jgi:hypothetical protein
MQALNVLACKKVCCMVAGMFDKLTPQDIESNAVDARVTMTDVLTKAGVSRGSFYRWKRGEGSMMPLTKARLMDAIAELKRAKVA